MSAEQRALVIKDGVMTGTNVLLSAWISIQKSPYCSFQAKWTSTPVGSFSFDISNDENPNTTTGQNVLGATPLPLPASFASGNPAGGATLSYPFDFGPMPYRWIRIRYTNASSSGVLNVGFYGKGASG